MGHPRSDNCLATECRRARATLLIHKASAAAGLNVTMLLARQEKHEVRTRP